MKRTLLKILICFLLVTMLSACVLGTPSQTPEATPTQTVSPMPTVEPTPVPTVIPTPTPPPDKVVEIEERFVVSQRSYDYYGYDTVILTIENVTDRAYDLKIKGNYLSADGKTIKTDEYFMYGFAANSVNYCMFCPYIDYDDFEFEISSTEYTGEVLFESEFNASKNSSTPLGEIRTMYSEQKLLIIKWTVDGKEYINHYACGQVPMSLNKWKKWKDKF